MQKPDRIDVLLTDLQTLESAAMNLIQRLRRLQGKPPIETGQQKRKRLRQHDASSKWRPEQNDML